MDVIFLHYRTSLLSASPGSEEKDSNRMSYILRRAKGIDGHVEFLDMSLTYIGRPTKVRATVIGNPLKVEHETG